MRSLPAADPWEQPAWRSLGGRTVPPVILALRVAASTGPDRRRSSRAPCASSPDRCRPPVS
ncbi:hypothetical protein C6T68_01490 [Burkholderia multivorans]|nr:hypothetical protein C6T68_01490 [Burkholderia multivorans]